MFLFISANVKVKDNSKAKTIIIYYGDYWDYLHRIRIFIVFFCILCEQWNPAEVDWSIDYLLNCSIFTYRHKLFMIKHINPFYHIRLSHQIIRKLCFFRTHKSIPISSIFHIYWPILYLIWICWKWRMCSRLMWSL